MLQSLLFCKSPGKKAIIFRMTFYVHGILINNTIVPTSVYSGRSHGCIRGMPKPIEQFFEKVEINTPRELIYKPV